MSGELVLFWGFCWVSLELCVVFFAATQAALALLSIGFLGISLLLVELDLVVFLLYATYASVFVALALLALHLNVVWAGAVVGTQFGGQRLGGLGVGVAILLCGLVGGTRLTQYLFAPICNLSAQPGLLGGLWQDLGVWPQSSLGGSLALAHCLLYSLFITETLVLNGYLFWALLATLALLSIRELVVLRGAAAGCSQLTGAAGGGLRYRVGARLRRATRRANTSRVRH